MSKASRFIHHDIKKFYVEVENEDDLDNYEGDLDVWVIRDPENDYKIIEDFFINHIYKNGEEINFVKQDEIPQKVRDSILNWLEYEV